MNCNIVFNNCCFDKCLPLLSGVNKEVFNLANVTTVRLPILANYLTNLFNMYEMHGFQCGYPSIKQQKMLLILQIYFHKNFGQDIDELSDIEVANCGFKIPNITFLKEKNLDFTGYSNKCINISGLEEEFLTSEETLTKLFRNSDVPVRYKKIMIGLFSYFADYDPYKVGQMLDKLKTDNIKSKVGEKISISEFNNLIDSRYNKLDEVIRDFVEQGE